jgi:peptide/nickel transport system permease protein
MRRIKKENPHKSQFSMAMESFFQHRLAVICFYLLVALYAMALLADFLSPYRYDQENREYSYCPPTAIEVIDQGHLSWPFVYGRNLIFDSNHKRNYVINPKEKYRLEFFNKGHLFAVEEPGKIYIWGADSRGRDLFSRLLHGARISLSIGLLGSIISFSLGLLVGGIAGYFGGWVDSILMRLCEMFMLVPAFYLMLAVRSAVPDNIKPIQIYFMVILILAFIGWASLARIIRGMSLSICQRDFVLAAKAMGQWDIAIIIKHVLPHTLSYSLVAIMLTIPSYILLEAGLSLFGLGIQDPIPSWGNMLSESMGIVQIQFAPWIMIPGLLIFITVICFNIVGDALRDAFDPLYKS